MSASPEAIGAARERLAEARRALAGRERRESVAALGDVLAGFGAKDSPWRRRLEEALPEAAGFAPATVERGLELALASWSAEAFAAVVDRESALADRVAGFPSTSVLLAGSIPMPTLLSLAWPLALHSPVLAKPASRDPVTAPLFREALSERDPVLAAALEIVTFPGDDVARGDAFLASDCVVATGSDETIAEVAGRLAPSTRFVGYGHRLSVAALAGEDVMRHAPAVALDVALWDQLGCLSPVAVFVPPDQASDFAEALARELASLAEGLPRGPVDPGTAAAIRSERDQALMRGARLHASEDTAWSVVCEPEPGLRGSPLHRFVRVSPAADRAALGEALAPVARHLAAVAHAGYGPEADRLADDLVALGASRLCAPGLLQAPPLGWHHDNLPLLLPLARLTDREGAR